MGVRLRGCRHGNVSSCRWLVRVPPARAGCDRWRIMPGSKVCAVVLRSAIVIQKGRERMAIEPEIGLSKETVFDGRLFKVVKEQVRLANGNERGREIVVHPGAVALVVVDNDDKLILVRQYRRAAD